MPSFDIIKVSKPSESFRTKAIQGSFDLLDKEIKEHFQGDLPIEGKSWNIGVIVGPSGTGKSTIAKELFGDQFFSSIYSQSSVIDDMPENLSWKDITKAFCSVGFASVPSWLKPYKVLSMGEKMRVDLANCLLQDRELIIFDEYTSVIDRQVAQFGSEALQKVVRQKNKKFIAVTCHYDVIDWLQPDWVFDTKDFSCHFLKGALAQKGSQSRLMLKRCQETIGQNLGGITI